MIEAGTGKLLVQQKTFYGLTTIFAWFVGILKVDLVNKLSDQILVKIRAKLFLKLYNVSLK